MKSTVSCSLKWLLVYHKVTKFLVSKETVVLGYLERETGKVGFIKPVVKGRITAMKDL